MSTLKWDRDFALEQAADDAELLLELIEIFKDSFQSDLASMAHAVENETAEDICSAAHSIKGASASLGILGVNDIALQIEDDSRKGSIAVAQDLLPTLKKMLEEVLAL